MPRPFVVALAALIGLVAAGTAAAHVVATPAFLASGSSESIALSAPNERDAPMTSFSVTAPTGLEIEHTHPTAGWTEELDDATATWSGGSLTSNGETSFGMTLRADAEPGVLELQARQLYDDGSVVSWPVPITVTPSTETPSQNLALAAVVGLIGVLAVVAVAMIAWRRRTSNAGDASRGDRSQRHAGVWSSESSQTRSDAENAGVPEPEPRYVLTFKPGSPEMVVAATAALVGACFAVAFSFLVREFACGEGDCAGFRALLVIACAGVVPTLGMLAESVRRGGHPWYWFFAAAIVYAFWGVVILSLAG